MNNGKYDVADYIVSLEDTIKSQQVVIEAADKYMSIHPESDNYLYETNLRKALSALKRHDGEE